MNEALERALEKNTYTFTYDIKLQEQFEDYMSTISDITKVDILVFIFYMYVRGNFAQVIFDYVEEISKKLSIEELILNVKNICFKVDNGEDQMNLYNEKKKHLEKKI